jgi:hypothetical protein|tara:strand:+ start:200 stop:442 length:243 start_codon:yes stop_codon:yes gene_type:complete
MSINMRDDYIDALRMNFKAQIEKHRINVENLMNNSVGIGEHGDVMDEIEKELGLMADSADKLEMLDYFEVEVGSKKVIKG